MTPKKGEETTQKFYISNLSPNVTKTAIARIFSLLGPVFSVKLLTNMVLHPSGGYAIVEMLRKTNIKLTLTRLRNTKIDGYKVFITTDKTYTETRNDIAELFSGTVEENLRAADEILSEMREKLPESKNVLQGGKFKKKLKAALGMGKGLNIDTCIELINELLAQKKLPSTQKKKKSSRSVSVISIPMGGQPRRSRR